MKHHVVLRLSAPFIVAAVLLALLSSCQKKEEEKKPLPITAENLQTAINREVRLQNTYMKFAAKADKERYSNIARLYRAVAKSEAIHAESHAAQLRALGVAPQTPAPESVMVGTVMQTLRMAESEEKIESESMYPNLIRTAAAENLGDIAEAFKKAQDADLRHEELFRDAVDRGGVLPKSTYDVCPACGLIMTSEKTTECPSCRIGKDKFIRL